MKQTMIITGANRGLGYEASKALAEDPEHTIVLAGRDMDALQEAARRIRAETGNEQLAPMYVDLSSLGSVRAFVEDFRARQLPPLGALICNAAVSNPDPERRSAEGYELTFAVNHLAHFLLTHLLLSDLQHAQEPGRIIMVSSGRHDPALARGGMAGPRFVNAEWLAYPERDPEVADRDIGDVYDAYATTKLCNILFTYELDRRLRASAQSDGPARVTVNAFDPGLVAGTGLGRNSAGLTRLMWYYVLPWLSRLMGFGRSVRGSGRDMAFLATAPEFADVSGKYFSGREMKASSDESYDRARAADLWRTSVALCDLQPEESPLLLDTETSATN